MVSLTLFQLPTLDKLSDTEKVIHIGKAEFERNLCCNLISLAVSSVVFKCFFGSSVFVGDCGSEDCDYLPCPLIVGCSPNE
jgi:hypothetical protein